MSIKQELEKIICNQIGASQSEFSISKYLEEGWMSEEDLFKAIKVLLKRKQPKIIIKPLPIKKGIVADGTQGMRRGL